MLTLIDASQLLPQAHQATHCHHRTAYTVFDSEDVLQDPGKPAYECKACAVLRMTSGRSLEARVKNWDMM